VHERKHVFLDKEVWKTLHELKVEWEKRSISDVVKRLIEEARHARAQPRSN
jgi:predicted CopG family antitoxin